MDTENIHIIDEAYGFKSGCYLQTRQIGNFSRTPYIRI